MPNLFTWFGIFFSSTHMRYTVDRSIRNCISLEVLEHAWCRAACLRRNTYGKAVCVFLWQGSVYYVFPRDFCGALHRRHINAKVAIPTINGIGGSSKGTFSVESSVAGRRTGGKGQ